MYIPRTNSYAEARARITQGARRQLVLGGETIVTNRRGDHSCHSQIMAFCGRRHYPTHTPAASVDTVNWGLGGERGTNSDTKLSLVNGTLQLHGSSAQILGKGL